MSSALRLAADMVQLDPQEVAYVGLVAVIYLREDGSQGYAFQALGDGPGSSYVGLLQFVQHDIIQLANGRDPRN